MAAIRVAAAAFLRSSGAIEEKEARRIRNAAAALLQAPETADGSAQVRFEEIFQVRLVDVETRSFRTAERLRELICDSGRDEAQFTQLLLMAIMRPQASVETDLVLTLFGKHEERPVQALGEAYINLREMAASGVDFAPPRVLEILNSRDEAVGHFSISVTAVVAFTALHYFV
ncbi:hypothetical protein EMIHUDRAFT_206515 [Emiliania huxleyi CCMP1516]|uniref:Uncharacterized protein n=2 Tax=Emiliania huxleyi TaxID=2903 RepID=A0A0D3I6E6_EMIH1|nr:hypothetical protein EMIHUDRAFT_249660 [Emiliania huxleyi CCMP1516]XP_005776964.1 hypothetical protein EMIHUDRAFT_206515 [Emiliania huxleyi CCMP1516]EOD06831.1 hypothetical protein EMIHUDRAFT_249660 [Emiliania huxleyi CCMP1516]EOD24535.1 hypothetical protein EMIHUDRAFT_206515 [Emiliania huxleyi CCMP1516]|eukprot:XP_005759260.1 hypothetical protein EMIHUDRAFT_249660 [Emiliania huxleyi CCMP1516]